MKINPYFSCDIFCRIVDNFGDIGISWRLARQLVCEFGTDVRVVVDDLASLQKLAPATNPFRDEQTVDSIRVHRWTASLTLAPSAMVIEAFGCELPPAYIAAMAAAAKPPVWLNLEYLSAEAWVGTHHLLPSFHPATGLCKYFFFPGFPADTGGLLREQGLAQRRDEYGATHLGNGDSTLRIFLFGYENAAISALFAAWGHSARSAKKLCCTIPPGAVAEQARALNFAIDVRFPTFVAQHEFDEMLWSHDVLFVRGEDSFVRAQWAGKPFIWQIYPQDAGVHWHKLNAFLDLYCAHLPASAAAAVRELTRAWNAHDAAAIKSAWDGYIAKLDVLQAHARDWAEKLAASPDLATNLVTFYRKTAKI